MELKLETRSRFLIWSHFLAENRVSIFPENAPSALSGESLPLDLAACPGADPTMGSGFPQKMRPNKE
jgi:hypothetical protein